MLATGPFGACGGGPGYCGVRGRLGRALHNWEGAESLPGADQLVPPGPAAREVQAGAASMSGDACGDVQESVAEPFWFPAVRRCIGQQEPLCPGEEILACEHELEPDSVGREGAERHG